MVVEDHDYWFIRCKIFVKNSCLLEVWTSLPKSIRNCHFCRFHETSLKLFFLKWVFKIFFVNFIKVYYHKCSSGLSQKFLFAQTGDKLSQNEPKTDSFTFFRRSSCSSYNQKRLQRLRVVSNLVSEGKLQKSVIGLMALQICTLCEDDDSYVFFNWVVSPLVVFFGIWEIMY